MERNHICKKCGGIAGWDPYFQSWICTRCGNMESKPITNYDRIISKTPEELAAQIVEWIEGIDPISGTLYDNDADGWLDWLKQEATE